MANSARRSLSVAACVLALGTALAACTPPSHVDSDKKVDTATGVAAPSKAADSTATTSAAADAEDSATVDEATIEITNTTLKDGESFTFDVTGLDPAAGYYAAICAAKDAPTPACTGAHTDTDSQAWLTADQRGTVTISEQGTATVKLTANPTGDGVDCTSEDCVLKVFGDHSEGFRDVVEVPVTFAS